MFIDKALNKTIKNEAKEQRGGLLSMLLGTLDDSLLENLLTGKGVKRSNILERWANMPEQGVIRVEKDVIKADESKLE